MAGSVGAIKLGRIDDFEGHVFTIEDDQGQFCMDVAYDNPATAELAAQQIRQALASAISARRFRRLPKEICFALTKQEQLRRVMLLCCHFARNLAYYRAGWRRGQIRRATEFWVTVNGNFVDHCVLEWGKLFGITASDRQGVHYWKNVVSDKTRFEMEMFQKVDRAKFDGFFDDMREYRNKFVAHLDQEKVMNIPMLELAKQSVCFYHEYIVGNEAQSRDIAGLPTDLEDYYRFSDGEAQKIYEG
jgi:hypothetical protein